jgi:hypothetical protein
MFYKKIYNLGDRLEDKIRVKLSHYPIIYAFIGGTGIIIFWRGVWHTADYVVRVFFAPDGSAMSVIVPQMPWWDGPASMLVGATLLLTVGLFVSSFIGNEIVISGLKKEKKIAEKTEDEIEIELQESEEIKREIHEINGRLKRIEQSFKK